MLSDSHMPSPGEELPLLPRPDVRRLSERADVGGLMVNLSMPGRGQRAERHIRSMPRVRTS